jgi:Sulfotransferase family
MSRADSPLSGRMIFNVGSRRSGTYWLQRIVTAHPDVAAVPSETHLFAGGIAPLFEGLQHSLRSSRKVGEVYVERDAALDATRDLCDVIFAGAVEPGTSRIAERTPLHVFHLELIAAIYPDARFVHIIRDGRDVARSIASQRWGPEEIGEAAAEWRDAILAARGAGLSHGVYREVRYEDLLTDPAPVVAGLYEWLGLEASNEVVAEAIGEAGIGANLGAAPSGIGAAKWREAYTPADLAAFDRVAGDVLRELGYPEPGDAAPPPPPPSRRPDPVRAARTRLAALRRPHLGRSGTPIRARKLQELVDGVVGALQEHAFDCVATLLTDDALVRVVAGGGAEQGRGEPGRDLLRAYLAGDSAFTGRQERGDVYLGLPYAGVVLSYRNGAGEPAERIAFLRFAGERVGELIIYEL